MHLFGLNPSELLQTYGYWAVFGLVLLETTGIPSPGETALITAGAYAGSTHRFSIALVVLAACSAAIIGDNLGYWVGRKGGWPLLRRYRAALHIQEWILKVGVYIFRRYGSKIVFFGRFVPLFRTYGALLAGVNRYRWQSFAMWNALGGIAWAVLWGSLSYAFGNALEESAGMASLIALGVASLITVVSGIVAMRHARDLRARAEAEMPGGLEDAGRSAA